MYQELEKLIEHKQDDYFQISDQLWELAEVKFEEDQSALLLIQQLKREGFHVESNIGGIPTAFVASFGNEGPTIGFLGEYDALPGFNQKANSIIPEKNEHAPHDNGHGCGHNLLGTGALAAAVATKDYLIQNKIKAQIKFFGCPAEEGGSGKTFMVRDGAFNDVDMAISWHPATDNGIISCPTLANIQAAFSFKGKSSHAANAPEMGRSALDAMELMNVGANYLREHVIPEARFHYSILDSGGKAPSVVQDHSKVLYLIRAPKVFQAKEIYERLCKIAEGAALMTETEVAIHFDKACSNYMPNTVYSEVMGECLAEIGGPQFDEKDWQYAQAIYDNLSDKEKEFRMVPAVGPVERKLLQEHFNDPLSEFVYPYNEMLKNIVAPGSTDVGDVSWVVPTTQCLITTEVQHTPMHSWQWVANGKSGIAKKGMLKAAQVMAATALKVIQTPDLILKAKAELHEVTAQTPYQNPIPDHVAPNSLKQ